MKEDTSLQTPQTNILKDNKENYEKLYTYNLNNVHEIDKFFERHKLPKFKRT